MTSAEKFYCVFENAEQSRNERGYIIQTNTLKILSKSDEKLIATLEHRVQPVWFLHKSVQYVLCPYSHSAVADRSEDWKETWYKTYIVNCETGDIVKTPIICILRGFYGFECSPDGRFLLSHTYSGYENFISLYDLSGLENGQVMCANILATRTLPEAECSKHNDMWFFDPGCCKTIKKTEPERFFIVPDCSIVIWKQDRDEKVIGFQVTTTCRYLIEHGFALTAPNYWNLKFAADKGWKHDAKQKYTIVENASAHFLFDDTCSIFRQTALNIFPYRDMPECYFNDHYEKNTTFTTDRVDFWGKFEVED